MGKNGKITYGQLLSAVFVSVMSPVIRLLPKEPVAAASSSAWLSVAVSAVIFPLYLRMMWYVMRRRDDGEGLSQIFSRCLGGTAGRVLAVVFAVWQLFYAGVLLRYSAERMLSSIYRNGEEVFFMAIMAALCAQVASGSVRGLVRTTRVYALIVMAVLTVVIIFSSSGIKKENLLPVTAGDLPGILRGALPVVNVFSTCVNFEFMRGYVDRSSERFSRGIKWFALEALFVFLMMTAMIGSLSAGIVRNATTPFFSMIKNISLFETLDRIESVIVALWIMTDVAFISSLLFIAGENITSSVGCARTRVTTWAEAAAVLAVGLFISSSLRETVDVTEIVTPAINAVMMLAVVPIVFLVGKLRKRI